MLTIFIGSLSNDVGE